MFTRGKASGCREHHLRAREHATRAGDLRLQAAALGGLGDAYSVEGKARSAHRCFSDCVRLAEANELPLIEIAHRPMAAFSAYFLSDLRPTTIASRPPFPDARAVRRSRGASGGQGTCAHRTRRRASGGRARTGAPRPR